MLENPDETESRVRLRQTRYVDDVDKVATCQPDELVNLETFPWPWPESSADEILVRHLLEHIGETPAVFLAFMKELWRVSKPSALIKILVPHPRCDEFLWDATHCETDHRRRAQDV